jgi:hypothetical protein
MYMGCFRMNLCSDMIMLLASALKDLGWNPRERRNSRRRCTRAGL